MPTYKANITDDQQAKIESAANDSGIPFDDPQGNGKQIIRAYDLKSQAASGGVPADNVLLPQGSVANNSIIGSHGDNASRFSTPGKA